MQGKIDGEENARLGEKKIQGRQKKFEEKRKNQRKIIQTAMKIQFFPTER